jgi:hypothetical protein
MRLTTLAVLLVACAPSGGLPPSVTPAIPEATRDTAATRDIGYLHLQAGTFKYDLSQNTRIRARSFLPETIPTTTSVTAILLAVITLNNDSSFNVSISVDSVRITSGGSIPTSGMPQSLSLGQVLHASIEGPKTTVEYRLPDSLCAYSHFLIAARELLAPQLPVPLSTSFVHPPPDTTTLTTCRGGTRIETAVRRELRNLRKFPPEFTITGTTELKGAGILRRDSLVVTGSVRTHGTASFGAISRLPSSIQTESEGLITILLGDSTTVFEQTSTQRIQHRPPDAPN